MNLLPIIRRPRRPLLPPAETPPPPPEKVKAVETEKAEHEDDKEE